MGFQRIKNKKISSKIHIVCLFIQTSYHKKISLSQLSKLVDLNPDYLSRKFKKETGISFQEFLLRVRIAKAVRLLTETEKKSKEIFQEVGFSQPEIFSRNFKKIIGCSPLVYRIQNSVKLVRPHRRKKAIRSMEKKFHLKVKSPSLL